MANIKFIDMTATFFVLIFFSLCGLNFSVFRKHIYVNDYLLREDAQTYCRQHHHDLSTITLNEAQHDIKNMDLTDWLFWIGLHKSSLSPWYWSGGEKEQDFWDPGEPNYETRDLCVGISKKSSLMVNVGCQESHSFSCMDIFELVLVNEYKTWEEALDYCRQNYIDLVSLTSENITADVKTNTMTAQTSRVWTGLRFLSGQWFWVSGDEYEDWSQTGAYQCPPINLRCAAFDKAQNVLKPQACEEKLNFFCFKGNTINSP